MQIKARRDGKERVELDKLINKRQRLDRIEETIRKCKGIKHVHRRLALGRQQIVSSKDRNENTIECRD